jgi:hypothetical protein
MLVQRLSYAFNGNNGVGATELADYVSHRFIGRRDKRFLAGNALDLACFYKPHQSPVDRWCIDLCAELFAAFHNSVGTDRTVRLANDREDDFVDFARSSAQGEVGFR